MPDENGKRTIGDYVNDYVEFVRDWLVDSKKVEHERATKEAVEDAMRRFSSNNDDPMKGAPPINPANELNNDGQILYEAYQRFSENGMTTDEKKKLDDIDATLKDASIQLTKNGNAIITDSNGQSVPVKGK